MRNAAAPSRIKDVPPCNLNPRLCNEAPNNRLADAIRTPILRWPDIDKRLKTAISELGGIIAAGNSGSQAYLGAIKRISGCLRETQAIFRDQEAALARYSEPTE